MTGGVSGVSTGVTLPKLALKEFNGDLKEWQQFSDMFEATIHDNAQLNDVQKHMYLRSVLSGEALSVVSAVSLTGAQYAQAWKLLKDRYSDSSRLTDAYLQAVLDLPALNRSAGSLRNFVTLLGEYLAAFTPLGYNVEDWAVPMLFILRTKLTVELKEGWQRLVKGGNVPSLVNFQKFLVDEAGLLEASRGATMAISSIASSNKSQFRKSPTNGKSSSVMVVGAENGLSGNCLLCKCNHVLTKCKKFENMKPRQRFNLAKSRRLCLSCLEKGHFSRECPLKKPCARCAGNHHNLLHLGKNPTEANNQVEQPSIPQKKVVVEDIQSSPSQRALVAAVENAAAPVIAGSRVLLMTVQTQVMSCRGVYEPVKVLLDCASQESFVTWSCVKRLGLNLRKACPVSLFGLEGIPLGTPNEMAHCKFKPVMAVALEIEALVVRGITRCPQIPAQVLQAPHLHGLNLADNDESSSSIDILLGAEWYAHIVTGKQVKGPPGSPVAVETIWGYCLMGKVKHSSKEAKANTLCTLSDSGLDVLLRQFWAVEEAPTVLHRSPKDKECEDHYCATVQRLPSGRYVVELPFLKDVKPLGDSRQAALKRFFLLERRLGKNSALKQQYIDFMADYKDQSHMQLAPPPPEPAEECYYIPHHCIYRQGRNGEVFKFRVVFDASMKSKSGVSLNQVLHSGPSLQRDIVEILINLRVHDVVLISDIKQMYRNILVSKKHHQYQRIFWRADPACTLQEFVLTTVTYGVSAAPFLAIRTLEELVADEGSLFPAASKAILTSTYMDEVVTSVRSLSDVRRLQRELTEMLARAGFQLRKWVSNRLELLESLPPEHCAIEREAFSFTNESDHSTKILGFLWDPVLDNFQYRVQSVPQQASKRSILSTVARLYDPLGYLAPVTIVGKCLIQYLWQLGVEWDSDVPNEVREKWDGFCDELPLLAKLKIPRCMQVDSSIRSQLHGFSDSSERSYAGVVYLRVQRADGTVLVSILLARAKVAPLKRLTLPRLELCAAVLIAKLLHHVSEIMSREIVIESVTAWTDSSITLSWIQSSSHRWSTFVANRVSQVQEWMAPHQFRYVPTGSNPTDCASRGVSPRQLLEHPLWWGGPPWLSESEENWPPLLQPKSTTAEARLMVLNVALEVKPTDWMQRFSKFATLKRVTAMCLRYRSKTQQDRRAAKVPRESTAEELSTATIRLVKCVQREKFAEDIERLESKKICSKPLRKLNPFIDELGLLRVVGRLQNSALPFEQKHPILLPRNHHLTNLIIDEYHLQNSHPGAQNLHCIIQAQYWIMAGRDVIRRRTGRCIACFKARPTPRLPFMGNLPAVRFQQVKSFHATGVDYGGPFTITMGRVRKAKHMKAYICLFVCLATRAVHLEVASDLSTDAFLAALRRFMSRRGSVKEIYSDQGTNFVGAKRILKEWSILTATEEYNNSVGRYCSDRGISWHLIPPASPHMGGLWESAIKSVKRLLAASVGEQILTYEEFATVLIQIEATLNTRPLGPMSTDPKDYKVLTPGHFLMLEPATAIVEPQLRDKIVNLTDRWKLVQQITKTFWRRWREEYLCSLQQRHKWNKPIPNLSVGEMVIIKEENSPPLQWRIGRITQVHPGNDGVVRVATVSTSGGEKKRPVVKLCPLPIEF